MNGTPHYYYPPEGTEPALCEVNQGYVWFMDGERAIRKDKLPGRFVRLVEAPALAPVDHTQIVVLMEKGEVRE